MVNKPLIRPYFFGGVALGGAARIPLICFGKIWFCLAFRYQHDGFFAVSNPIANPRIRSRGYFRVLVDVQIPYPP